MSEGSTARLKYFNNLGTDLLTGQEQSRVGRAGRRNGVLRGQADRLLDALLQAVDSADGVLRGTVRNALFHQLGHAQGKKKRHCSLCSLSIFDLETERWP